MKEEFLYFIELVQKKEYTRDVIKEHVDHLKKLDSANIYVLGGPLIDRKGGMIIIKASSKEQAEQIAVQDPFVTEGFSSYQVFTLNPATKENNYLL